MKQSTIERLKEIHSELFRLLDELSSMRKSMEELFFETGQIIQNLEDEAEE